MAGFLDKKDRIIDMVLTSEGKRLLSKGKLRFSYFALFDDEVDYSPYISESGSMSADQLSASIYQKIETTLVREASTGYKLANLSGSDFVNVHRPLFTIPQGQRVLPRLTSSTDPNETISLETKLRKLQDVREQRDQHGNVLSTLGPYDRGYERYDSSVFSLELKVNDFPVDEDHREGVLVRVFHSGAEGLVEVGERYDLQNDLAYSNDLKIVVFGRMRPDGG